YDPIPTRDYYSLYGVLAGAQDREVPLLTTAADRAAYPRFARELRRRRRALEDFHDAQVRNLFGPYPQNAGEYLLAAHAERHGKGLAAALVNRWGEHLEATRKEFDPIFAPWHAFARLEARAFRREAPKLARKFAANEDEEKRLNPLVAKLFKE